MVSITIGTIETIHFHLLLKMQQQRAGMESLVSSGVFSKGPGSSK
jgi:hypothetical protein